MFSADIKNGCVPSAAVGMVEVGPSRKQGILRKVCLEVRILGNKWNRVNGSASGVVTGRRIRLRRELNDVVSVKRPRCGLGCERPQAGRCCGSICDRWLVYVTSHVRSATATIAMADTVNKALGLVIRGLSDYDYEKSLASYRFWFDIGQTYYQIPPDQIFDVIWNNRAVTSSLCPGDGRIIHAAAHLILRFARDAESGHIIAPDSSNLQSRLCARSIREFFSGNVETIWRRSAGDWSCDAVDGFHADVNLIAHWANLGYIEETVIRDHILQSLSSHSTLLKHQVDALIILFKLAGVTFEAYAEQSLIDRCFQLLNDHRRTQLNDYSSCDLIKKSQIQGCAPCPAKGDYRAKAAFQEVVALRERRWEGLPPPPVFTSEKPKLADEDQRDPASTPVATSLGLPNRDPEPQPLPLESVTAPEEDAIPPSPVTRSPSISIATLSEFTIADTSDDESSINPTIPDTSDDEPLIDPTMLVPHGTFYLEDGNVEVLCGNTLFRVHTTVLSFQSPALRRMFAQTSLATAESPNGCPRILSSDTPKDFATLLKIIYLPEFVILSTCHQIVPLITYLFTDSPNGIKCRISSHSRPSSGSRQSTRCPPSDLGYLRLFVVHIQRPLRGWPLPRCSERASLADPPLTQTRSSTSSSSRG